MTRRDQLPVTCQLCGEHYSNNDALWDHECPAWEREVRRAQPRLAVYRNIQRWYDKAHEPTWARRLADWSIRTTFPDDPDADILDMLGKKGPKFARRLEAKLIRRGLVRDESRSEIDKIRRKMEIEEKNR